MNIDSKLKDLAKIRKSDEVIVYITSDKQPLELFSTQIASDIIPLIDKYLYRIGKQRKISLFLYSTGGLLDTPWPLVSLIREYCKTFEVIIPSKALSAATLICLGADKIVMTPLSALSPVDPQGNFMVGNERKQVQIGDVTGFIDFAKSKVGISEQGALAEIMKTLSVEIPPSVLGSVNRTHSLIRLLSDGLIEMHRKRLAKSQKKEIIENLTEKLFSHQHLIGRHEAKYNIGFKSIIDYATVREEKLIRDCFEYYKNEIQLEQSFNPAEILQSETNKTVTLKRAIIQSSVGEDAFLSDYIIHRIQEPNAPKPFEIRIENQRWEEIKNYDVPTPSTRKGVKRRVVSKTK